LRTLWAPRSTNSANTVVELYADCRDGALTLSIRDNGIGGAEPSRGSGIIGLTDRVEAVGGTISLRSPAGAGTRAVRATPGVARLIRTACLVAPGRTS
jgi:signal transduction histidine kinase